MSEVLIIFTEPVTGPDGTAYTARVCGTPYANLWEGWIEFIPAGAEESAVSPPLRTTRETEQPNRSDLAYWATGLTYTYLEGALARALRPPMPRPQPLVPVGPPPAPGPAPERGPVDLGPRAVLDPFQVYEQGERILLQELSALGEDHLRNILAAYRLHPDPESLSGSAALVAAIVGAVKGAARA